MSNLMKHWTVCHTDYCNVREGTKQQENYVEPNETLDGVSDYCNVREGTKQQENYVEPNETLGHTDYCNVRVDTKQHENPRWLRLVYI